MPLQGVILTSYDLVNASAVGVQRNMDEDKEGRQPKDRTNNGIGRTQR